MYLIISKHKLNSITSKMVISAPLIANKAQPGQFIILRVNDKGERIPLTIFDFDKERGTIEVIYQKVGKTTMLLDELSQNDYILDVVGPLGKPSKLFGYNKVLIIGGGTGCAIAYPQAKALYNNGIYVDVIAGFRNKDMIILKDEFSKICNEFFLTTDDGSAGIKGFVTEVLESQIKNGKNYDLVFSAGPLPMMKAVSIITKNYNIKNIVSMNPIMIDGTGMCGGCRLTVGGEVKFACVDGPDFDGHEVNFAQSIQRLSIFNQNESKSRDEYCNLFRRDLDAKYES